MEEVLRKLQLTELEILNEAVRICERHGLQYYFVGGTLLGAVRHKGFIPWDDDLDIAMPRTDYNRFIDLCKSGELDNIYYLHHTSTDKNYWNPFAKIRKNHTVFNETNISSLDSHKGIYIDIFPLDYCKKNSGLLYHNKAKTIKILSAIIKMKILKIRPRRKVGSIGLSLLRAFSPYSIARLRDFLASTCKDGKYIINYGSNYAYTKQTMPREVYEPAVKIEFENGEYCVPHKYITYLENLFGDWQKLPPESERCSHHKPEEIVFDTSATKEN